MYLRMLLPMIIVVLLHSGCSTLAPTRDDPVVQRGVEQDASFVDSTTPARMAIIWKEGVINAPGTAPVRGLSGRIYFYNLNDELVKVDGQLVVYGYDDSKQIRSDVPDKKYIFPAEKFRSHYSPSELGHSYTVWIPWENYGGERKSISLVPSFKTVSNQVVQGGIDHLSLSGRTPKNQTVDELVVRQTNQQYGENLNSERNGFPPQDRSESDGRRRSVDTLPIPKAISDRMLGVPQNRYSPVAVQRLSDMESADFNPDGALYNKVNFQHSQSKAAGQPFVMQQSANENLNQFNRSSQPIQMIQPTVPQNRGTFGKPGAIR